jgi:hypothetical protein
MSCSTSQNKTAQTAAVNAISETGSKNGYVAGSTSQVAPFAAPGQQKAAGKRRTVKRKAVTTEQQPAGAKKESVQKEDSTAKKKPVKSEQPAASPEKKPGAQASFFEIYPAGMRDLRPQGVPTQGQIKLANDFTPEELQTISVQLRLGAAAASRQIRELSGGAGRGIGHSDPRPLDWAKSDQRNFQFLAGQVTRARRDGGTIDTSSLKKEELFDLWEFSNFEADRAHRNIDHLFSGGSHLRGPTAEYLAELHKLDARFYTFLARQLEPMITPEMVEEYYAGL